MIYEIQSKSDFQIGATLIVKIPEADLDLNAMNTILADRPEFILPFRHRVIDGQIEFTYQIGNRSKITYLSGSRSPIEYAKMWIGLLQPLLDCSDWFMTPYSFVLSPEYLYYDKTSDVTSFVYIPSLRSVSDEFALKNMVAEIAKLNHVTDISLENKVVWALQDFNINDFLQLVKTYKPQNAKPTPATPPAQESIPEKTIPQPHPIIEQRSPQPHIESTPPAVKPSKDFQNKLDDISINFPADGKIPKEKKQKGSLFGSKKEKEPKEKPAPKEKGGVWGKKKPQQEIIEGAAAMAKQLERTPVQSPPPVYTPAADIDDDVTQLDINEGRGAKLRYVGTGGHPRVIEVNVNEGAIFTIGRFDASVGTKQSDFEFDKKTKAVSRRHAAVERSAQGYSIVDLDSGAGTFLGGQKLPPNAPFDLTNGCRVSFGHSGADYIWEE